MSADWSGDLKLRQVTFGETIKSRLHFESILLKKSHMMRFSFMCGDGRLQVCKGAENTVAGCLLLLFSP